MYKERGRGRRAILIELRRLATMEQFGSTLYGGRAVLTTNEQATAFIKTQTALWRDTWVLPLIDELIAKEKDREPAPPADPPMDLGRDAAAGNASPSPDLIERMENDGALGTGRPHEPEPES